MAGAAFLQAGAPGGELTFYAHSKTHLHDDLPIDQAGLFASPNYCESCPEKAAANS